MTSVKQFDSSSLSYGPPDDAFWGNYSRLWHDSAYRSPFQAPQILRYFVEKNDDETVVFQYFNKDRELRGATLFWKQKCKVRFLSDLKTDANFFTLHRDCTQEETREFFTQLLNYVKAEDWSVTLNNQPAWAGYMEQFRAAGKAADMYWMCIPYSVCPIVSAQTEKELFEQINKLRELRYRVNKLRNQQNAEFEILTDDSDLDHWTNEFCQAHILRWADTPTPSSFQNPNRQQFVKGCFQAWADDGILVRFSVKVNGNRVGFVIGLREGDSLIHHSTTFHPDFKKNSPGKALIWIMAEWMAKNDIRTLDFGDGDEPYKYTVANEERILQRIFTCNKSKMLFPLKSKFIKWTKEHPKVYGYYVQKIKRLSQTFLNF